MSDSTQGLDMPDGVGWWAFEGRHNRPNVTGAFREVVEVIKIDDSLMFHLDDSIYSPSQLIGKWYRLHMPWETPSPVGASVLWSDERITNEAYEFAKKEGAHSMDAVEMIARRMRDDYEAHRGTSVPSEVWVVYRTDGYHPSDVAYFASEDEAKKCAEWSRAEEVRKYQKIDVAEFYADDYGVYSMPLNTTFATWLAQQRGQG